MKIVVDTHFRDTFRTSPIQLSSTSLWAQFMYYILFYSFKHGPSPCDLWRKLRKCDLEGMSQFLSDLLHELSPCILLSGQGTLVAPQAHGGGLISKIFTPKQLLCFGWPWPKVSAQPFFFPLNIVGSHWPTPSASPHLGEPPNGLKFLTKGNQLKKTHFIFKIMLKAYQTLP